MNETLIKKVNDIKPPAAFLKRGQAGLTAFYTIDDLIKAWLEAG